MTETLLDNKKVGDKTPKTITTTIYCNYLLLLQTISNKLCRCWAVIAIARESIHHIFQRISYPLTRSPFYPQAKSVNTNGLYNLSVDLESLEGFADSCGVLQLRECFSELRQTLGVLLHRDIDPVMRDPVLRQGLYPKSDANKLIMVLEKYKPMGVFSQVR